MNRKGSKGNYTYADLTVMPPITMGNYGSTRRTRGKAKRNRYLKSIDARFQWLVENSEEHLSSYPILGSITLASKLR